MTLQSLRKTICLTRFILIPTLLILASVSAAAQTNTFPTTGNAGAGTTSPDRKLEAQDSGGPQLRLTHTDASVYADFQTLGSGHLIISPTGPDITGTKPFTVAADSDAFRFYTNADTNLRWSLTTDASGLFHIVQKGDGWAGQGTRFSMNRSGNVGIGTTSPSQKLNVIGNGLFGDITSRTLLYSTYDSQLNPFLEIGYGTSHSAITPFPTFVLSNNTTSTTNGEGIIGQIAFANRSIADNNDKRTAAIVSWVDGASNSGTLQFYTSSSGTLAERIRITPTGKVGIDKIDPAYKLDVNGEINATGLRINGTPISSGGNSPWLGTDSIYYNSGNVGIGTTNPSTKLELAPNSALKLGNAYFSSGGDYVHLSNNEWFTGTAWAATAPGALIQISGQDVNFYRHDAAGSHTQSMNINSSGNVGIGMSNPVYSLDVNGGVNGFRAKAATASSSDAVAVFENSGGVQAIVRGNGYVGMGTTSPAEKLEINGNLKLSGTGNINAAGTIEAGNIKAKYQDLAEWVPSSEQLAAGTVVVLDTAKSNQVISSSTAYDTRVAGVISAQPGITLGEGGEGKVLVATTGRVRVKVDASRGPIQIGDLLVTSEVAGVAMKSEAVEFAGRKMHMPGTIIGKALEPLAKGSGEILVLLSLQ
ncbi:MAG TPA: hypothetical protein VFX97_03915 [Pyrinomonadaceae bacterium]|nr:hypothetical protein [Pyrinomonadaceae bacterium]